MALLRKAAQRIALRILCAASRRVTCTPRIAVRPSFLFIRVSIRTLRADEMLRVHKGVQHSAASTCHWPVSRFAAITDRAGAKIADKL